MSVGLHRVLGGIGRMGAVQHGWGLLITKLKRRYCGANEAQQHPFRPTLPRPMHEAPRASRFDRR
jgi:hypothetical protein